ncbi:MAG TPA: aminodeoxychorismate lyase [Gammaproteobacteria bacterium]|nr:aminodeoxychorismate lyase [Gammaproteobacteria bacterium]
MQYFINGQAGDRVSAAERALHYGDGLFETIRVRGGEPEYLARHMQRLNSGCEQLQFPPLDWALVREELLELAALGQDTVLKYILSRGVGGRGYRPAADRDVTRIASLHPLPHWPAGPQQHGVRTRICSTRLAAQPLLAGIKHLNRLEQVLARAEWDDDGIAEGLMLDQQERLIEGTMSNLFIVNGRELLTPELSGCGVAGVMRSVILDLAVSLGLPVRVAPVTLDDVRSAGELFVCNSLAGIWPVVSIESVREFSIGRMTRQLQVALEAGEDDNRGNWYRT